MVLPPHLEDEMVLGHGPRHVLRWVRLDLVPAIRQRREVISIQLEHPYSQGVLQKMLTCMQGSAASRTTMLTGHRRGRGASVACRSGRHMCWQR
jgi:hypothetical protein